jgi:UPF0271 protein
MSLEIKILDRTMEAMEIDLNSDLGEGCRLDADILALVTSANISCGFHAGDVNSLTAALNLAVRHNVSVGAHPGYPDREHFGRRELAMTEEEIERLCGYQIGALHGLAKLIGAPLRYLKPHGALYNQACRDDAFARPVVAAAIRFNLPVVGLPRSRLETHCQGRVPFVAEGYADRRYLPDGSLVPRSRPDAFVDDPDEAVRQAERLIEQQGIRTLCVHGDNPQAVAFVKALSEALLRRGLTLKAFA